MATGAKDPEATYHDMVATREFLYVLGRVLPDVSRRMAA
jgi:hypothetical protein